MKINIEKYQKQLQYFISRLSDIRFVGQIVFVIIVLLISWSGIKTIQTNYSLQKKISTIKQQNEVKKLQNNNLELQNNYYKSDQFIELSARQNFGLAANGEKEVLVPEKVALSYTVDVPAKPELTQAEAKQPSYQRNFQAWVDFFMHRQSQN